MSKLICEEIVNGEAVLKSYTVNAGSVAAFVKTRPGVGQPFWVWPTVPSGTIVACDFTNAPIVTNNTAQNQALIDAITTPPESVLVYE